MRRFGLSRLLQARPAAAVGVAKFPSLVRTPGALWPIVELLATSAGAASGGVVTSAAAVTSSPVRSRSSSVEGQRIMSLTGLATTHNIAVALSTGGTQRRSLGGFPSCCCGTPRRFFSSTAREATYYDILGLVPPADAKTIRFAYLKAAKQCHPDLHGSAKTDEFKQLQAAYDCLSSATRKAMYDANGYRDVGTGSFKSKEEAQQFLRNLLMQAGARSLSRLAFRLLLMWTLASILIAAPCYLIWSGVFWVLRRGVRLLVWIMGGRVMF